MVNAIVSIPGYVHLYRSLLRFYDMPENEVREMLYLLNTANLDCYEYYHPEHEVVQSGPVAFSDWLEHMQQIDNRRFMYNPKTGILVLGCQYAATNTLVSSHANELADAGITKGYDEYVRGWIGTGGGYPKGVIHFAPCVDKRNIKLFNQAFDTLEMFRENGALAGTVVRGFGESWEQPLSDIFTDMREPEQRPSVRRQLKKRPEAEASRQKTKHQQER